MVQGRGKKGEGLWRVPPAACRPAPGGGCRGARPRQRGNGAEAGAAAACWAAGAGLSGTVSGHLPPLLFLPKIALRAGTGCLLPGGSFSVSYRAHVIFCFFLPPRGVLRLNVLSLQFDKFWAYPRHLCSRNCLPVLNPLFSGAQINPKKQLRVWFVSCVHMYLNNSCSMSFLLLHWRKLCPPHLIFLDTHHS